MNKFTIIDAVMYNNNMISLYKNPTYSDIDIIKHEIKSNSIRGFIDENGDIYAWNGNILHMNINHYFKYINFDNKLKFSYEDNYGWLFDASFKNNIEEYLNLIIKNKNKLLIFGDLNSEISIFNIIRNMSEQMKIKLIIKDNNLNINVDNLNYLLFLNGISEIEKLRNFLNKK